eukprot:gene25119-28399_t
MATPLPVSKHYDIAIVLTEGPPPTFTVTATPKTGGAQAGDGILSINSAGVKLPAEGEERLRYSFMSLDRDTTPPSLVVGEYARGKQTRRLVRFALDPETHLLSTADDNLARPFLLGDGVRRMQGAVMARGRLHVT